MHFKLCYIIMMIHKGNAPIIIYKENKYAITLGDVC